MPKTRDELFAFLENLGIETETHEHEPVFTVEESKAVRGALPGGHEGAHCKNLFLKDKKGQLWLVVAQEDRAVDMKELRHKIGAHHLSFGKPDLLMEVLGIEPGSVTPFALIIDPDRRVTFVLDRRLMGMEPLHFHPLTNRATTGLSAADFRKFLADCGHTVIELTFPVTAAETTGGLR